VATGGIYADPVEVDRFSRIPPWRQVADELRRQIEAGEIPPGRPIPSKRTAKETWGIAGNTYEKAVQLLKSENRIATSPGMGLYVTDPSDWRR
jgi:GntR family transcriptional regulator